MSILNSDTGMPSGFGPSGPAMTPMVLPWGGLGGEASVRAGPARTDGPRPDRRARPGSISLEGGSGRDGANMALTHGGAVIDAILLAAIVPKAPRIGRSRD